MQGHCAESEESFKVLFKDFLSCATPLKTAVFDFRAVRAGEALCFGDVQIKKNPVFAKWNVSVIPCRTIDAALIT